MGSNNRHKLARVTSLAGTLATSRDKVALLRTVPIAIILFSPYGQSIELIT